MYFGSKYLFKAKICRKLFHNTKFFLGERVNYSNCKHDFWDVNELDAQHKALYFSSYARYKTIELLSEEVKTHNIAGSVAELGVYKGTTSVALNILFPSKKLFLFDTFEGFDEKQNIDDVSKGLTQGIYDLSDTSEEFVMAQMIYPENCIVRKGLFPDTADGLEEEKFCFVSLDVDLYEPILDGLRYFYPRLEGGGYIVIHDYNNDEFKGVKKAVKDFERETGEILKAVPITDLCGSVVVCK